MVLLENIVHLIIHNMVVAVELNLLEVLLVLEEMLMVLMVLLYKVVRRHLETMVVAEVVATMVVLVELTKNLTIWEVAEEALAINTQV